MDYWQTIDRDCMAFSAANELLKLAVFKESEANSSRRHRLHCFHSWRAVLQGIDAPLDPDEMRLAANCSGRLVHLVTNDKHREQIQKSLGQPAIFLPLTSLQDDRIYRDLNLEREFDVFFSCMFTDAHVTRKRVDLLFRLLDKYPHIRVAWVGGFAPYERWSMEHALNWYFSQFGMPGPEAEAPWTERESSLCWSLGGGVFDDEERKQRMLKKIVAQSLAAGYDIQFYPNLSRDQVVHLMNRCKASLCLSTNDLWPRSLTEAMACGTPAVAMRSLISGLESIHPESGVVVDESTESVMEGLQRAWTLSRQCVRETYFSNFGLTNGIRRLVVEADAQLPNWTDIVTVERPAESAFKRSLRQQVLSVSTTAAAPKKPE